INTFGAVIGAIASGFLLIPAFGMHATTTIAASMNVLLGLVALATDRSARLNATTEVDGAPVPAGAERRAGMFARLRRIPLMAGKRPELRIRELNNPTRIGVAVTLAAFALSGFVALSYEVIWSRVLALIIGSSVYAFSIMLATFLIGLAAGASL